MQVDELNISFDQFSHDLTLALEETSRLTGSRWTTRRRTRSTGNLPFPPQPTEEDSSSTDPNNAINDSNNNEERVNAGTPGGLSNSILSDSDDRHSYAFTFKVRQHSYFSGNFESDSLNENFSPSKPNIRRKRKFKRIAMDYETTAAAIHQTNYPLSLSGAVKKRVLKHNQENLRGNLFFGKRKRRDRYVDYSFEKHSSSVPRQRGGFLSQKDAGLSFLEYKSRNRASSMSTPSRSGIDKILPLNKSILSKIEKISQETQNNIKFNFTMNSPQQPQETTVKMDSSTLVAPFKPSCIKNCETDTNADKFLDAFASDIKKSLTQSEESQSRSQSMYQKSGVIESSLVLKKKCLGKLDHKKKNKRFPPGHHQLILHKNRKHRQLKLQFDDQNFMDCGNFNDFLSSSSLSSSDSETEETNESDHEGDDELTDWPGTEVMVNFTSKNEFKRATKKIGKTLLYDQKEDLIQDDDTLMSADEVQDQAAEIDSPNTHSSNDKNLHQTKFFSSNPINIVSTLESNFNLENQASSTFVDLVCGTSSNNIKQHIESEMSGETSNNFLSSPNTSEIREIRAGCRRVGRERFRPAFSIVTSFNEDLFKFLQDEHQKQLKIYDVQEYDKVLEIAKLYSLNIESDQNCIFLNKTSNTMQAVKVSSENKQYFFSDYKRRCVGGDTE